MATIITHPKMTEMLELDQVAFFDRLSTDHRAVLAPVFTRCRFPAETSVFSQGNPAENLYILLDGEVQIRYKPYDGPELTISHIHPGEVFGWSSALGSQNYTASARASADCELLRMRGVDLQKVCREQPEVGAALLEILAAAAGERYNNTHHQVISLLEYGLFNLSERRASNDNSGG